MFANFYVSRVLLVLSVVNALPLNGEQHSRVPQFHELATRSVLNRLDKRDQPRLAQNSAKAEDLPIVTLPYGQYRATKYVKDVDVSHVLLCLLA
jgi:hypothetical protein